MIPAGPRSRPERFRQVIRVRYVDTDQGGVVHHSTYFHWLESARVELMRHRGVEYKLLEGHEHIGLAVVDASIRYRYPARFDDLVEVETWVAELKRATIRFDYIVHGAGRVLADAEVTVVCVDLRAHRARSLPDSVRTACALDLES